MGCWGMGITQSDEYGEVYDEFMERYNEGEEVSEITDSILSKFHKDFDDNDGIMHDVYFALAKAEWMCCEQSERVLAKVQQIVENKENIEFYRELEACETDLKLRERNLKKFLQSLKTPRKQQKKRIPKPKYDCAILEKGSIFWYQSKLLIYGVLVLEKIEHRHFTEYLLALTKELSKKPKKKEEVLEAEIYTVAWFSELLQANRVHIIDQIEILGNYNGRAGLFANDNILYCENTAGDSTWMHNSSSVINFPNKKVKDLLIVENVPCDFKYPEHLKELISR